MTEPSDRVPFDLPAGDRPAPLQAYTAGATEPWTAQLLAAYVRAAEPKVVIETGSFSGETTRVLAEAMSQVQGIGLLFTVEMDESRFLHVQKMVQEMPFAGVGISVYHADALEFLRNAPTESADMIFLDDDHNALHVKLELLEVRRVLRHGGACFVHDVMSLFNLAPVLAEFGGICLPLRRWHPSGGLGIIVK